MTILDTNIARLDGTSGTLADITQGRPALLVNVASKCGLTPQYTALEALQKDYESKGFTVIGLPCNQFAGQEPGSAEEIQEFCSATYGVTFPMTEKIDVNGDDRHPIYQSLTQAADQDGKDGDIQWNFEKFVIDRNGAVVQRFSPQVTPDDARVVAAITSTLE